MMTAKEADFKKYIFRITELILEWCERHNSYNKANAFNEAQNILHRAAIFTAAVDGNRLHLFCLGAEVLLRRAPNFESLWDFLHREFKSEFNLTLTCSYCYLNDAKNWDWEEACENFKHQQFVYSWSIDHLYNLNAEN